MTDKHGESQVINAARVLVGRHATPPPPNAGSSSLLDHLVPTPARNHCSQDVPAVLTIASEKLVGRLAQHYRVYGAVPGLSTELFDHVRPRIVIVDATSWHRGPWSAVVDDHGSDLRDEVRSVLAAAVGASSRSYMLVRDVESVPEFASMAGPQIMAPGSPLFEGVPEGAPSSRLVQLLKEHLVTE